jgi:superfamily I DNA and/or RNA helicase
MEPFEVFKEKLLAYLHAEQNMEKEDIEATKQMSREEKIEANMMLANLTIAQSSDNTYILNTPNNYSKLRSGDKIVLKSNGEGKGVKAIVVDTSVETVTVQAEKEIDESAIYDLEEESPNLLNALIGCLEGILPATPGAAFLRMLAKEEPVEAESFLRLVPEEIAGFEHTFSSLNKEQQAAVRSMLEFYPIHVLQGPPGTGKTRVLAATAIAASLKNREVVIIANTHQAVNNALLKIRKTNKKVPLFKIGELLKAEDLGDDIHKFQKFAEYNDYSRENRRKKKMGYVIGMTIWGAISSLGLRTHSHFRPYLALVDEASLMPLTYASILGKCSSSVCFFGDSRQMPPIFRPELEENTLSTSILDYCAANVEGVPISILPVTHRMNSEITAFVSKAFYEPHGIVLHSAEKISGNRFNSPYFEHKGKNESIVFWDAEASSPNCLEENEGEADAVIEIVKALLQEGKQANSIAVITPFRKQVRLLRSKVHEEIKTKNLPLIDTVERLQGQDVDCIILSFASSDKNYIDTIRGFLFNPNRLNVMISRAKTKVVIIASETVQKELRMNYR